MYETFFTQSTNENNEIFSTPLPRSLSYFKTFKSIYLNVAKFNGSVSNARGFNIIYVYNIPIL